jgi:hypothetical protein
VHGGDDVDEDEYFQVGAQGKEEIEECAKIAFSYVNAAVLFIYYYRSLQRSFETSSESSC